jgi:cyanophycin synthetase
VFTLQTLAACTITFSKTIAKSEVYQVLVEYSEEIVGQRAYELALKLMTSVMTETTINLSEELDVIAELNEEYRLGPSTQNIVSAAIEQGIPYRRLTDGSLVQLGWGVKQQRIQAAESSKTSLIAEDIAQDKALTKALLEAVYLPVPSGRIASTLEDAWRVACELGFPVVVKPLDGNQGKGVTVNVDTQAKMELAFNAAHRISNDILIEVQLIGHDYRLLVVGDRLIAAAQRNAPLVIGDGRHNISELVAIVNSDPLRGSDHGASLTKMILDPIALLCLSEQNYTVDTVLEFGERAILRRNANLSTGGNATDVTPDVHPEIASLAIKAARVIGLDICGIDFMCEDISKPLSQQPRSGIIEVNAAPGLRMHISPSYGQGQNVGHAIIQQMFSDDHGRIPVVAVSGTNGKTTTVRFISHLLQAMGHKVGMTNTDGIYINKNRIDAGDCAGPKSAERVLLHPDVDAAVFETARGGILREGLGFDRCDVAVMTNIGQGDHLGLNYIDTVEELAATKQLIVSAVNPQGYAVLNADDLLVVQMATVCPGAVIFFSLTDNNPLIAEHRVQGRRVMYVENNTIILEEQDTKHQIDLSLIPLTNKGLLSFQVANAMASIGALWALGYAVEEIIPHLSTFSSHADLTPGRFNQMTYNGASIIVDYGHNVDAMLALAQYVKNYSSTKTFVVTSAAGDRKDEIICEQMRVLGDVFDTAVLYEIKNLRGRKQGEIIDIMHQGFKNGTRISSIKAIPDETEAITEVMNQLVPGNLCLLLVDAVEESLMHLSSYVDCN